jgi:DNA-binding transcriptional LysR family regulator
MLEINDLHTVRAIAEHGSLARAARVLGIGQPALTRRLAGLEARLKGQLFLRGRQGALPTDLARLLLSEAAPLLAGLETLEQRVTALRGHQTQDLVLAAGAWAAESIGATAAVGLLTAFPSLRIRLRPATWLEIPTLLRERKATLGLLDLTQLGTPPDLTVLPLQPQPGLFLVRPAHPLLAFPRIDLRDAMEWPLIFLSHSPDRIQTPMAAARAARRTAGASHPAFPALILDSPLLGLAALRHSDAVVAAPAVLAGQAIAQGEAVALAFHAPWMMSHWGIIHRRGQRLGPEESALIERLRAADAAACTAGRQLFTALGLAWPG